MTELVRAIKVLEYVGPREWVEISLNRSEVHGKRQFGKGFVRAGEVGRVETLGEILDYEDSYRAFLAMSAATIKEWKSVEGADSMAKWAHDNGFMLVKIGG